MTPEQTMRASAIAAAAAFCAPFSGVDDGKIPALEDVLFVADVFHGYIEGGWQEALGIYATGDKQQDAPKVHSVELREESTPVEDILLSEPEAQAPSGPPPHPSEAPPEEGQGEGPDADVIPIEVRGHVTKEQNRARRMVDKIRRDRAMKIFNQSRVAKSEEHKHRLLDEAEQAGLLDYVLRIEGQPPLELGAHLASL